MPSILVRPIEAEERLDWEPLWRGYQTFYEVSLTDKVTETTWHRLHDPAEPMRVLGAYVDGALKGIVHYIFHRSCWTIGDYCYLQDLFVAESARGLGLGRALITAVYEKADAAGASRVYWLTHETNQAAMGLYNQVADRSGFIQYRKML